MSTAMSTATAAQTPQSGTRIRRSRRAALAGVLVTGIVLFASACGSSPSSSPGVAANGGSSSTASASSSPSGGSAVQKALAYAACMRSHGVSNFPDPNSQGQFQITSSQGINVQSSQYQRAQTACQSLAPTQGGSTAQNKAAALQFSACMRSHGVSNFPDPNANGGFMIGANNGIDPNSPQFQSAQKACQKYMPGASSGGGTITSGGGA
jgi:hypothetical protein